MQAMIERIEAFVGEYASGKSEVAINRALQLKYSGKSVTLADLDLVEPVYTLRPLKQQLIREGLRVIAWETHETLGLGEAGMTLHPEMKSLLKADGVIVLDVGYGVYGSEILNVIDDLPNHPSLRVYMVVNITRPMTSSVEAIIEEATRFKLLHGLVNNSHLGPETTVQLVTRGATLVSCAATALGKPVIATAAVSEIATKLSPDDVHGQEIWPLNRYMPNAFW